MIVCSTTWLLVFMIAAPSGYPGWSDIYPHKTFATEKACKDFVASKAYDRYTDRYYGPKWQFRTGRDMMSGDCATVKDIEAWMPDWRKHVGRSR